MSQQDNGVTRRDFVKTTAALSAGALVAGLTMPASTRAAGSDLLKIGLVGCGGRGKGAVSNCLDSSEGLQLWALGDLFPDAVEGARNAFAKGGVGKKNKPTKTPPVEVPADRCFSGFDNYKKVIDSGVDLVLLATPPGFRPGHFDYAVKAGKHVFMEKPVAVDPTGYRIVVAAAEEAKKKNLAVVAGTQRRHSADYMETMKKVHEGAIGELTGGEVSWMGGGVWVRDRKPGMSDMEYQCRNWYYFVWLCGDQIVEQHVHNLDVMCWAFNNHPKKVMAVGGRQVRTDTARFGHIYDHIVSEFEFDNGAKVTSWGTHMPNHSRVGERIVGTKGFTNCRDTIWAPDGKTVIWKYTGSHTDPYVQEHADLIASIRSGKLLNEGAQVADSTMCAIMGRMSAYTGKAFSWDWVTKASKLDTFPKTLEFGPLPVDPVAMPGTTPLI